MKEKTRYRGRKSASAKQTNGGTEEERSEEARSKGGPVPCCIVSAFATDPSGRARAGAPCRCLEEDTDVRTDGRTWGFRKVFYSPARPAPFRRRRAACPCPVVRTRGCDIHPGLGPIPYDTPCERRASRPSRPRACLPARARASPPPRCPILKAAVVMAAAAALDRAQVDGSVLGKGRKRRWRDRMRGASERERAPRTLSLFGECRGKK